MFYQEYDFLNEGSDDEAGMEGGNESSDDDDLKRVLRHIGGVQEDEDFETSMENELNVVVKSLEADRMGSSQASSDFASESGSKDEESTSSAASKEKTEKKTKNVAFDSASPKFYDDDYFNSDDDEPPRSSTEEKQQKYKHPVIDNDDLFYDPDMDDQDQAWVDNNRQKYHPKTSVPPQTTESTPASARSKKARERGLPTSDAVLDCPACMTTLCLDCQRHEVYHQQYRAMFVKNCSVDKSQSLKYKAKKQFHKKRQSAAEDAAAAAGMDEQDVYHPVKCTECGTEVAVYDKDEIYHFFNVLASHA